MKFLRLSYVWLLVGFLGCASCQAARELSCAFIEAIEEVLDILNKNDGYKQKDIDTFAELKKRVRESSIAKKDTKYTEGFLTSLDKAETEYLSLSNKMRVFVEYDRYMELLEKLESKAKEEAENCEEIAKNYTPPLEKQLIALSHWKTLEGVSADNKENSKLMLSKVASFIGTRFKKTYEQTSGFFKGIRELENAIAKDKEKFKQDMRTLQALSLSSKHQDANVKSIADWQQDVINIFEVELEGKAVDPGMVDPRSIDEEDMRFDKTRDEEFEEEEYSVRTPDA